MALGVKVGGHKFLERCLRSKILIVVSLAIPAIVHTIPADDSGVAISRYDNIANKSPCGL
jgi:hypothetical protein